jgi:hypothetical protein
LELVADKFDVEAANGAMVGGGRFVEVVCGSSDEVDAAVVDMMVGRFEVDECLRGRVPEFEEERG